MPDGRHHLCRAGSGRVRCRCRCGRAGCEGGDCRERGWAACRRLPWVAHARDRACRRMPGFAYAGDRQRKRARRLWRRPAPVRHFLVAAGNQAGARARAVFSGRRPARRGRLHGVRLRRFPPRLHARAHHRHRLPEARRGRLLREARGNHRGQRHPFHHGCAHGGALLRRS